MSKFLDAQREFELHGWMPNKRQPVANYLEGLHRNYGSLQGVGNRSSVETGVGKYVQEQKHKFDALQMELDDQRNYSETLERQISQLIDERNAASVRTRDDGHDRRRRRRSVLPSLQTNSENGHQAEGAPRVSPVNSISNVTSATPVEDAGREDNGAGALGGDDVVRTDTPVEEDASANAE